ncbi:RNA polymerase sigma factor [Chondromyces apiculatus]|uniref:RNA polymerase sigma factor 70 region 4 type 2 domain-containing protein n=1 Tax=Chondromyces apiculatus DSM 436 TaxID=1192034 RepID=A0A017TBV2_9BACT|nr:sigma factor-like helix-turn-helix DNA-binding protein [Chondromyces apiculatus]EYF06724.1 Hypothetical protein CAP_1421 [Chondromyces apiculatus DSM 436]
MAKVDLDDVMQDVLLASFTALDRFDVRRYARSRRSEGREGDEDDDADRETGADEDDDTGRRSRSVRGSRADEEGDARALRLALDAGLSLDRDAAGSAHDPLEVIRAIAAGDAFGVDWAGGATPSASGALAPPTASKSWSPLGGWLFGIAWRQVSHYRHRAYRRREVLAGLLPPRSGQDDGGEAPAPDTLLAESERVSLIVQILDRIDIERRVVLVLHDLLELEVPQIAEELGLNRNTTQNRLRLARIDFQALVRRLSEEKRQALMPESAEVVLPARRLPPRRRPKKR